MAGSTSPLPELRSDQATPPRLRRQTRRRPLAVDWSPQTQRLYPRGGMVDIALREFGAVLTLVWPRD